MNSDFMKKCREHQLAVIKGQERWDGERRRRDPEFQPRDSDWDAPPVRPFDAKCNYYEWLGVTSEATFAEVRKAYKQMCLKYHPDKLRQSGRALKLPGVTGRACDRKYEEQEAREVFLKLQEAFEILSDQATRRQYDRQRISEEELDKQYDHRRNRRRENEENAWKPPPTWKPKLKELLKKGKKKQTPTKHVAVVVSLEDVLTGCERTVSFERRVVGRTGKLHTQTKTYQSASMSASVRKPRSRSLPTPRRSSLLRRSSRP
jgi:DnaJ-class molecular chaperone